MTVDPAEAIQQLEVEVALLPVLEAAARGAGCVEFADEVGRLIAAAEVWLVIPPGLALFADHPCSQFTGCCTRRSMTPSGTRW